MNKKETEKSGKPSPEESMRLIEDGFYRTLGELQAGAGLPGEVVAQVRARVEERAREVAGLIQNGMDEMNVRFTLLAVALFDVVEGRLERGAAFRLIDDCLNRPLRGAVIEGTRRFLDASPDPFAALVEVSKQREGHSFGPSFAFERRIDDRDGYVLQISRCLFHEVLRACGRQELQPLLCRFDLNWIDAVDPERHRVRFVRPCTFATSDRCQFWFARTDGDVAARLPVARGA